MQYMQQTCSK